MFTKSADPNVHAAKLYAWLLPRLRMRVPAWVYEICKQDSTSDDRAAKRLAAIMGKFAGEIPLNTKAVSFGDMRIESHLNAWWFDYRTTSRDEHIRQQALMKLDPDELRVLGLV